MISSPVTLGWAVNLSVNQDALPRENGFSEAFRISFRIILVCRIMTDAMVIISVPFSVNFIALVHT